MQPSSSNFGDCAAKCVVTGLTITWIDSLVTYTFGAATTQGCACPVSTSTQTSASLGLINFPATPGFNLPESIQFGLTDAGYMALQNAQGSTLFKFYIGGCEATSTGSTNACQGAAVFRYKSDTVSGQFGTVCDRVCATSSYNYVQTAGGKAVMTPAIGVIGSCYCYPIVVTFTGGFTGSGLLPDGSGATFASTFSSATSTATATIAYRGTTLGTVTYSVSECAGAVAESCPVESRAASGRTSATNTNSQVPGSSTSGGTPIIGNAAYYNAAAGGGDGGSSSSSNAAAIGGGIGGAIALLLLIGVGVAAYYGKLPCCKPHQSAAGAPATKEPVMVARAPAPVLAPAPMYYASAPAPNPVSAAPASVAFCSNCGSRQAPGAVFCGSCGTATSKLATSV